MSRDPALRRRLPTGERQEEIVRAAMKLAADKGVDGVTTQDMADALGITQGAIFRHFAAKDEIWSAVMAWIQRHLGAALAKAAEQGADPLAKLERMFFAHVAFIARHPAIPGILFSQALHRRPGPLQKTIQEIMARYEERVASLLEAAKAQGLVHPDLDVGAAATLYIGMIQGLVMQVSIFRGTRSLQREAERVFPVWRRALSIH